MTCFLPATSFRFIRHSHVTVILLSRFIDACVSYDSASFGIMRGSFERSTKELTRSFFVMSNGVARISIITINYLAESQSNPANRNFDRPLYAHKRLFVIGSMDGAGILLRFASCPQNRPQIVNVLHCLVNLTMTRRSITQVCHLPHEVKAVIYCQALPAIKLPPVRKRMSNFNCQQLFTRNMHCHCHCHCFNRVISSSVRRITFAETRDMVS